MYTHLQTQIRSPETGKKMPSKKHPNRPIHEICAVILRSQTSLGMKSQAKGLIQILKLPEHKISSNLKCQTKVNNFYLFFNLVGSRKFKSEFFSGVPLLKTRKTSNIRETFFFSFFLFNVLFVCLGPHLQRMEAPRLEVELKLQLLAYTPATAMRDPSHICNLHYSSRQHGIFNPQRKARD